MLDIGGLRYCYFIRKMTKLHLLFQVLAHELSKSERRTSCSGLCGAEVQSQEQFDYMIKKIISENKATLNFEIFKGT
jgi:hypothetical protein